MPIQFNYQALWDTYIDLGIGYARRGLYSHAERIVRAALKDARSFTEIDPRLIGLVHVLASHYQALGCSFRARRLYREILEVEEEILGRDHPHVVRSVEQVALFLLAEDTPMLVKKLKAIPAQRLAIA